MTDLLKIHLVFEEIDKRIITEINKYGIITGRDLTLEDACEWAQKGGGEDPDIFLINCSPYFSNKSEYKNSHKRMVKRLTEMLYYRSNSRLVLLLPNYGRIDTELLSRLIKLKIYDFWCFDRFDENDIKDFLSTKRTLEDVEDYLRVMEAGQGSAPSDGKKSAKRRVSFGYKPYYIKSNVIAFWSDDDSLLNLGAALLTAISLAENGFKVALVETISHLPRLASVLSVGHPYFNTRHALAMFMQNNNDFIRNCLFNGEIYLKDGNSPEKRRYIADYPEQLYFLPDSMRSDSPDWPELQNNWKSFIIELARIIIFENDFSFLIFVCQGKSLFNDIVVNELAYVKFISVNMLPGSIAYALDARRKGRGNVHVIGTRKIDYIMDELTDLGEDPFLYPPVSFEHDFTDYAYIKKHRRISDETRLFIKRILDKTGVKLDDAPRKRGFGNGFSKLLGVFGKSIMY